jgi:hypothetical protein
MFMRWVRLSGSASLALLVMLILARPGDGFQVELEVTESAGVSRQGHPVTMGVPLARGTVYSDQDVQIAGVPGQFTALSCWPDGSVKWLLCDFPADVPAYGTATYYLSDGAGNTSHSSLQVTENSDSIAVVTGPVKFIVSKTSFNLFHRLWLDEDGSGTFEADEQMIAPHADDGPIVTDDGGTQYLSALDGDVTVQLEEEGPLRVSILAEGWHRDASGQRGLDFTVRIQAYSDQSYVRVFYTFYNRQSTSIGCHWDPPPPPESYFDVEDISLRSHVAVQGDVQYAFGGEPGLVHSGSLQPSQLAYIYGYGTVTPGDLQYLIGGSVSGSGGRARGWADISDARWGMTAGIRQFWQHFPKGIEVNADGEVWVRLIPEYYDSTPINPDDAYTAADLVYCGAAKTHEIFYYFHPGDHEAAGSEEVIAALEQPLYAFCTPQHYCQTEVFGRMPPRDLSLIRSQYRWIVEDWENKVETMLQTMLDNRESSYWSAKNEYGMWNYGDSYQSEWSNMQYDTPYSLFMQFCRTGDRRYFDLAVDQCRHYRDVDIVHHMGDVESGSLREAFVGSARRLPNINHALGYDTDFMGDISLKGPGLIYHYFFTGDRQSLHGGKLQADYVRNSALRYQRDYIFCGPRRFGMGIEALLAYYEASGDESYLNNGVYHLGDISSTQKASAYTLARKVHEHQNISPDHPEVWDIWGYVGCDCDDGLKFESINYGGCSWQAGMTWDAMLHYYQITGDTVARDDILRGVAWMCDPSRTNLWNGSYFHAYDPDYGDWYEGHGKEGAGFINGVLGFAYGQTGNIDYIDKAVSALDIQVNHCGATTDPKWFAQVTKTIPRFFYYLTEEFGVQDTIPPNAPTGLHLEEATEHSIELAWTPPAPASDGDVAYSYDIYRDGLPLSSSLSPQYEDTGLEENSTFEYAVYAVDNAGNPSTTAAVGTFGTLPDTVGPVLDGVNLTGTTGLEVVFSEPVEQASAEQIANYAIAPGITVLSAVLQGDLQTVRLSTTEHAEGQTYTLTLNNIRDRAAVPNTIAANTQHVYQFQLQLLVTDIDQPGYVDQHVHVGEEYYIDRPYTVISIPSDKTDLLWIKTANDDKMNSQEEFLSFTINIDADLYVGYDHRAGSLPDWIADHFTDSGLQIEVSDTDASPMTLWARPVQAGTVTLGGNMAPGASGAGSMYVVLLGAEGTVTDTLGPQISGVNASAVSESSAAISWTTDEPADSRVEYGLSSGSYPWSKTSASMVLNHQLDLTGLAPSTVYHYRVVSTDGWSNTTISQEDTFTTPAGDTSPPVISQVQAGAVTTHSATITWLTDEPSDSQVEYGPDEQYGLLTPVDTILTTGHQITLSGLQAGQLYHYRVRSADEQGNPAVSGDDTFTTPAEDTSPPVIDQIAVLMPTDSTARMTWMTDEGADSQVEYGFDAGYGFLSPLDTALVQSHQVTIDLPPPGTAKTHPVDDPAGPESFRSADRPSGGRAGTASQAHGPKEQVIYHFRVLSRDAWDNLAVSEDDTFSVDLGDTQPPAILNLQIWDVRDTCAHISWETDEPARSELFYGTAEGQYEWSVTDTALAVQHLFDLRDLTPDCTYHLQARAEDLAGNGSVSADTVVVTKHELPHQPGRPQHWDD